MPTYGYGFIPDRFCRVRRPIYAYGSCAGRIPEFDAQRATAKRDAVVSEAPRQSIRGEYDGAASLTGRSMKGFTRGQIRAQIQGADSRGPIRAVTACWSSNYSLVIDQNRRWQRVPLMQRKPLLSVSAPRSYSHHLRFWRWQSSGRVLVFSAGRRASVCTL